MEKDYEFIVSSQPEIKVKVTAGSVGIDTSLLYVFLDEETANKKTFSIKEENMTKVMGNGVPIEVNYKLNLKDEETTLVDGEHIFRFTASNQIGTTSESATVTAMGGDVQIIGVPLTYPSPIHLSTDNKVTFQYGLSTDADIDIYVFDVTARVVKKLSFNAGASGGSAGGTANPNKVEWDFMSDQGYKVGSGIYLWNIVDKNKSKIIGKGKMTTAP